MTKDKRLYPFFDKQTHYTNNNFCEPHSIEGTYSKEQCSRAPNKRVTFFYPSDHVMNEEEFRSSHCSHQKPKQNRRGILFWISWFLVLLLFGFMFVFAIYFSWQRGWAEGYLDGRDTHRTVLAPSPIITPEGGPCDVNTSGTCGQAEGSKSAIQWSRYYLRMGDAQSALKKWGTARNHYRKSINLGKGVGAQSAIYAAKRIQYLTLTCEYDDATLSRISRDYRNNPYGELIRMKQKQQALKALAYYSGVIDNRHGAKTREAIRKFQADLWFDQTGVLTAEQTVLLICGGAQIAKDINSQNVLGIMYAGGLGVHQNTDYALNWLETASQRGDADASWNLALLHGTQTVLSSVLICDAVQNAEQADSFLREAEYAGHLVAKSTREKYNQYTPNVRWRKLKADLNQPNINNRVGRGCNPN